MDADRAAIRVEGYGALKTMLSGANPFQLQNALHSALKLRFFKEWGDVRAAAQTTSSLRLPSSLRGGFKKREWNQGTLRFLILASFNRFAIWGYGGTLGLPP